MVALSSISTRHPNERPTHPVDPSRALTRPVSRKIRSSTRSASYDHILRSPEEQVASRRSRGRSNRTNASYDRIDRLPSAPASIKLQRAAAPSLFSAYRVRTHLRIGMTVSFSS